ncbi:MAG: DUF4280 domain-containing protein [Fusobacteriaceae bacterium]|nr:DUF4280 domain-containing protein [Fusobacteriaceae bacterium]
MEKNKEDIGKNNKNKYEYSSGDKENRNFMLILDKKEKTTNLNKKLKEMILSYMKKADIFPPLVDSIKDMLDKDVNLLSKFYEFSTKDVGKNSKTSSYRTYIKIGIFDDGDSITDENEKTNKNYEQKYGKSTIGYIYGTNENSNGYDLYGNLLEIPVFISGIYDKKIPSTTFVCSKASLSCPKCPSPGVLTVTSQDIETNNGFLIATNGDDSASNIKFAKCGKSSCSFAPAGSWQNVSKGVTIDDQSQLLDTSTISCVRGGTVSIINPNCVEHGD